MKERIHNLKQTVSAVTDNDRGSQVKTSISKEIFFTSVIILVLVGIIILVTHVGHNGIVESLDIVGQEGAKRGASANLRFSITQILTAPNDFIITGKEFYRQEFNRLNTKVDEAYTAFTELPLTMREKQLAIEIKKDVDSIRSYAAQIFSIQNPRYSPEAVKCMEIMDYRFGNQVEKKTTEIFELISKTIAAERIISAQNGKLALITGYGAFTIILFIIIVVTILVHKKIAVPIKEVTKAANEIALGNYSYNPVVKTDNEINVLAKTFVMMSEAIQESNRQLKESEKRYRNLFETTNDLIQTMTPDGHLLYTNRAWRKKLGYTEEELISLKIDQIVAPDALSRCNQIIQRTLGGENVAGIEMSFVTKEGKIIHVDGSLACIFEAEKPTVITCFLRDISDRKMAEERIKLLSSVVEQMADMAFITDKEGIIEYVNPSFEKRTGYTKELAIGKTPRILYSGKQGQDYYEKLWKTILAGEVFYSKTMNKKKNGQFFYVLQTISPIKDDQRNITNFVSTCKDITEQIYAEEALINSEAKFSTAFRSSPDVLVISRLADGMIVDINEMFEKMFGVERKDILGKSVIELNFYADVEDRKQLVSLLEKESRVRNYEVQVRKKSGELRVGEASIELIEIEGEQCMLTILRDITESKRIEKELIAAKEKAEEMNRLKTNFLANMSHEIRTPLIGILGFSEILQAETADPEHKFYSQNIFKSGNRLMETLNLILTLSKIESNKLELKPKEINVASLLQDTLTTFLPLAKEKGLYLETNIGNKNVSANLDQQLFINIINNLMSNAVKYTNKGGVKVEVDSEIDNGEEWAVIRVKDTGVGIPEEKYNLIFEEFRQVSEGLSRGYEGAGLGLTLAKKIVELMEGTITVESKVNVGSAFTVKFPSIASHNEEQELIIEKTTKEKSKKQIQKTYKTLYVEDDPVSQDVVKIYLEGICEVTTAENYDAAIEKIKKINFDFFMVDINLRDIKTGIDFLKETKKLPEYKNVKIAAVTAYALVGDKEEFLTTGFTHYISKPFNKSELLDMINQILESE